MVYLSTHNANSKFAVSECQRGKDAKVKAFVASNGRMS